MYFVPMHLTFFVHNIISPFISLISFHVQSNLFTIQYSFYVVGEAGPAPTIIRALASIWHSLVH